MTSNPTLYKVLKTNLQEVTTVSRLHERLSPAAEILECNGHEAISANWRRQLAYIPKRMDKEAINYVLLRASWEVEAAGVSPDLTAEPEFRLQNPPPKTKRVNFGYQENTVQKKLIDGLGCLPGQQDLF